jgi:hypothetical protein
VCNNYHAPVAQLDRVPDFEPNLRVLLNGNQVLREVVTQMAGLT